MSLIVLSGCSLPGLGDGDGKDSVKITATETSETKLWQILKTNDRTLYKWQNKTYYCW